MKSPLLEFAHVFLIAAASGALVLGAGNPAWGTVAVTEEQAEAAVVAAAAADADGIGDPEPEFDVQVVETVIWSEPQAPPEWFPPLGEDDDLTVMLSLSPSPVQSLTLVAGAGAALAQSSVISNEPAVIPLPPAAWTGLAGLASLAIVHGRKAIIRFFT